MYSVRAIRVKSVAKLVAPLAASLFIIPVVIIGLFAMLVALGFSGGGIDGEDLLQVGLVIIGFWVGATAVVSGAAILCAWLYNIFSPHLGFWKVQITLRQ